MASSCPALDLVPDVHEDLVDVARHLGVNIDLLEWTELTGESNDIFQWAAERPIRRVQLVAAAPRPFLRPRHQEQYVLVRPT